MAINATQNSGGLIPTGMRGRVPCSAKTGAFGHFGSPSLASDTRREVLDHLARVEQREPAGMFTHGTTPPAGSRPPCEKG
jgi:hypothetical protein